MPRRVEVAAWVLVPLLGALFLVAQYERNYYVIDDWLVLRQTLNRGWWGTLTSSIQGHIHLLSVAVYRLQRTWLGIDGQELIYAAFVATVLALELAVAATLRRLGTSAVVALAGGAAVAFNGAGAEVFVWPFAMGPTGALAFGVLAGFVVLGGDGEPDLRRRILVVALLTLSIAADSGVSPLGFVYVAVVAALRWPLRAVVTTLGLPALLTGLWYVFGDIGENPTAELGTHLEFAVRLLLLSGGAFAGGGTAGGVPMLLAVSALTFLGWRRGLLSPAVVATFWGGLAGGAAGIGAISLSRAGLLDPDDIPSRYVTEVAVFLVLAFLPPIAVTTRALLRPRLANGAIAALGATALVATIALTADEARSALRFHEAVSDVHLSETKQAVQLIFQDACPPGQRLDPAGRPSGTDLNKADVTLLQDLIADGSLDPVPFTDGVIVFPEMFDRLCTADP